MRSGSVLKALSMLVVVALASAGASRAVPAQQQQPQSPQPQSQQQQQPKSKKKKNAPPPQLDYRGLGFRVPCLIISPYAKDGYVDHTQYEFGSILKFIEEVYGTGPIGPPSEGYTDTRATSLDAAFDFTQQPRPFTAIPSKYPPSQFLREPPSYEPVDTE